MRPLAYLAFGTGFVWSGVQHNVPVSQIVAGLIFFAVLAWMITAVAGILSGHVKTPGAVLDEREELRRAARSLRNRPGAMNTDLTGIKPRNKGSVGKHLRWVKK